MVNVARNKFGKLVYAKQVSRAESASIKSAGMTYKCRNCSHTLTHRNGYTRKNKTVVEPTFVHEKGLDEAVCPFISKYNFLWYDASEEVSEDSAFVEKWAQSQPLYVAIIDGNGYVYTFGSKKAVVNVYDSINIDITRKYRGAMHSVPELFILNAKNRKFTIEKAGDNYWIQFENKCEVEHILHRGGWVVLDNGDDQLYILNDHVSTLKRLYLTHNKCSPDWFYKASVVNYNEFVECYMPDGYIAEIRPVVKVDIKEMIRYHACRLEFEVMNSKCENCKLIIAGNGWKCVPCEVGLCTTCFFKTDSKPKLPTAYKHDHLLKVGINERPCTLCKTSSNTKKVICDECDYVECGNCLKNSKSEVKHADGTLTTRGEKGNFYCGKICSIGCSECEGICGPAKGCNCIDCLAIDNVAHIPRWVHRVSYYQFQQKNTRCKIGMEEDKPVAKTTMKICSIYDQYKNSVFYTTDLDPRVLYRSYRLFFMSNTQIKVVEFVYRKLASGSDYISLDLIGEESNKCLYNREMFLSLIGPIAAADIAGVI